MKKPAILVIVQLIIFIGIVIGSSILSNKLWQYKSEKITIPESFIINSEMSIAEFGSANNLSAELLKDLFQISSKTDLEIKISQFGSNDQISSLVSKKLTLKAEQASKNWRKIFVKFILWIFFLTFVFVYAKNRKLTPKIRKWLLFISLTLFGIILGSDPGPMGTVKDALFLFSTKHIFFLPRLVALLLFLTMVIVANKYICAWGCQAGTFQDLIFRLNQKTNGSFIGKKIKLPFWLTNTIRITFFILFILIGFVWGVDIIDRIDIFKVFNPIHLGYIGIISAGVIIISGLFIYRPWCHLICPFGLIGWIFEKWSLNKISVDYKTCIGCKKCIEACPSQVMNAILIKDKKVIPDCFSCYSCREVCPTGSIRYSGRKRTTPPVHFFDKK